MTITWRRIFRMSPRSLMVVILILGVFLGWRVNRAHNQRRAVNVIRRGGGIVTYDYQYDDGKFLGTNAKPHAPEWLRRAIGEEYFREVKMVTFRSPLRALMGGTLTVTDDTMAAVAGLDQLESLHFNNGVTLSDGSLAHLSGLTRLERLDLQRSVGLTNRGLSHLGKLTNLRELNLNETSVSDASLESLRGIRGLEHLYLAHTKLTDAGLARIRQQWGNSLQSLIILGAPGVTDAGMVHFRGMVKLRNLYLYRTPVTDAGLANLSGLTDLVRLDIPGSLITDASLVHLRGLKKLQRMNVDQTSVSNKGLDALKAELPVLKIATNRKRPTPPNIRVK